MKTKEKTVSTMNLSFIFQASHGIAKKRKEGKIMSESIRKLTEEELAKISGGAVDYTPVYPIFDEIVGRFQKLIQAGSTPDEARSQTKSEYWGTVMDICCKYPDNCPPEEQANVILTMLIGS